MGRVAPLSLNAWWSFRGDWFYNDWDLDWPDTSHLHINYKEVLSVVLAARRWAPQWRNCKVIIFTDCERYVAKS